MARFRLSTDILSPLNSDISLNDTSAFSFGSLPDTPVFDSKIASPLCSANSKETDVSFSYPLSLKECANASDEVASDIKKHSSLNSETAETNNGTYEELKRSIDDLFGKDSHSSIFQSQLKNKLNNDNTVSIFSETNTVSKFQNSKNQKLLTKSCSDPENTSEIVKRKHEKCTNKKSIANKLKPNQHQSKQTFLVPESVKEPKNKNKACISNDTSVDKKKIALPDKKTNSKFISKSDGTSLDIKKTASKGVPKKKDDEKAEDVKDYNFKCQKKIPVSGDKPVIKNKNLSIEKSIQLAVSMEMDNIHRFVLNQNLFMHKDLLKFQEMAKKQNEVTEYLFSVIDELLDTNKQLISKFK